MAALENRSCGWAALDFAGMAAEQVLFVLTLGQSMTARGAATACEVGLTNNAARGGARFVVNASGETRIFLNKGTLEVSEHAARRITQRGLSLDIVENVVTKQKAFQYFHEGVWKTGYYDAASRVFVGTVNNTVRTVIGGASANYIRNLQGVRP